MNKKNLLLIPLLILCVGCNSNGNTSLASSSEEATSSEAVSSQEISSVNDADLALNVILNQNVLTNTRKNVSIKKDGTTYFNRYTVTSYDENNGIKQVYMTESGYNNFDVGTQKYDITETVYYDGYYSYTSQSDNVYLKQSCKLSLSYLSVGYDCSVVSDLNVVTSYSTRTLTGNVEDASIAKFFGKTKTDVSNVTFQAQLSGDDLSNIKVTYTQNGYSVTESTNYGTGVRNLSLPTLTRNA